MASAQVNGAPRTAKSSLSRVIPAIPHAFNIKKKGSVKTNGATAADMKPLDAAQQNLETSTEAGNGVDLGGKKMEVNAGIVQLEDKELGTNEQVPQAHTTQAEANIDTDDGDTVSAAKEAVADETPKSEGSTLVTTKDEQHGVPEEELVDVREVVTPRVAARSPHIKSPVIFGGNVEPDMLVDVNKPSMATAFNGKSRLPAPNPVPSGDPQRYGHENTQLVAAGQHGSVNGSGYHPSMDMQPAQPSQVSSNGVFTQLPRPPLVHPGVTLPPQTQTFVHNPKAANFMNPPHALSLLSNGAPPSSEPSANRQPRNSLPYADHEPRRPSLPVGGNNQQHNFQTRPTLGSFDRDAGIAAYIHSQFGSAEFADYVLRFPLPPFNMRIHSLIIARSPRLRSLMAMPQYYASNADYLKPLDLRFTDRFLSHDVAFMKALMRLYGEVLPDRNFVLEMATARAPYAVQQEAMRFALSFTAVGHYLQVEELVMHGLSLSASLLSWENVTAMLSFALEGGLSSTFTQIADTASTSDSSRSDGTSTPSKQIESSASSPVYGIYSDRALHNVIGFLLYNLPTNFRFSSAAPQLSEIPRLPAVSELPPMHERNSSRLSQIRFGDMAREEEGAPNFITTTLSSILLTLPFPVLAHIFNSNIVGERIGWERTAEMMHALVTQREQRRLRALQHGKIAPPGLPLVPEDRLWNNTRWVEGIEPTDQHPAGLRLVRHFSSGDTPNVLTPLDGGSIASS